MYEKNQGFYLLDAGGTVFTFIGFATTPVTIFDRLIRASRIRSRRQFSEQKFKNLTFTKHFHMEVKCSLQNFQNFQPKSKQILDVQLHYHSIVTSPSLDPFLALRLLVTQKIILYFGTHTQQENRH